MSTHRLQLTLALGILALGLFEWFQSYPILPDPMASNFGGDGTPGGWSSKRGFVIMYAISMAFWLGALLGAPLFAARARRGFDDAGRAWLRDTLGWFLLASLAFSAIVAHWVLEANLVTGRLSEGFGWLVATYMAYVAWWTVRLVRRARAASISNRAT